MWRALYLALAIGWMAPASILMNDAVGVGGFDASVRVGNGTGTVFMSSLNGNLLMMCIITADHVLGDTPPATVGIRGSGNGGFDITAMSSSQMRKGPTGTEDVAFVNVTVDLTKVTEAQAGVLKGIMGVPLAAAPGATPFDITAYGYGATARPATADEKLQYMGAIYVDPLADPAFAYGVERTYKASISTLDTYNKKDYKYPQMNYSFMNKGDGLGLGGDSGEGLISNNKIVGVYATSGGTYFSSSNGMPCTKGTDGCDVLAINQGTIGSGVALTSDDVTWFDAACPEPASFALLGIGLALLSLAKAKELWL